MSEDRVAQSHPVPADYQPLDRKSAFSDLTGPYYTRPVDQSGHSLGLLIQEKHLNKLRLAHGGVLMTLADNAFGDAVMKAYDHPVSFVTVSMNSEFLRPAALGDWVESEVEVLRKGERLVFADCTLLVRGKKILHASAVMALVKTPV